MKTEGVKKHGRKECSAINCQNYQSVCPDLAFHRFPRDPDRCAKWVQNLQNKNLMRISSEVLHRNYRVCSSHFHPSQFKRQADVHAGLNWNAIPTRVNAPNPPPLLDLESQRMPPKKSPELDPPPLLDLESQRMPPKKSPELEPKEEKDVKEIKKEQDQTIYIAPVVPSSPAPTTQPLQPTALECAARESVLKRKIKNLQKQLSKLRAKLRQKENLKGKKMRLSKNSVLQQVEKLLPAKSYSFFRTQMLMAQRKGCGFRWSMQDKAFFLSLLHASPKCYRLLSKIFSMPSIRTLQRLMKSIRIKPGLNKTILSTMKKAAETMLPTDKICAICSRTLVHLE